MEKQTGNSKNLSENNDIITLYTSIDNFNIDIKINYLSVLNSYIILTYLNYIVCIFMLIFTT